MFYDIFAELCEKREIKPSKAAEECGINKSNVSSWKNNGYVPRGDALNKIAAYFGVSTDYLLGNEQKEKPAQNVQVKKRLRSVARLEDNEFSSDEDKDIDNFIQYIIDKRSRDK